MLPEGWKESPNMAVGLVEKIFFPFKTPLNKSCGNFTIDDVFNYAKEQKWSIGLWIDLTNTKKYYNPSQVESKGVQYLKLAVVGRQSPSLKEIRSFNQVCNKFITENPDKIIGIHCTHGFNRTGFLICSFLSQVLKLDVHAALRKFAETRPPGIYRQNMVDDIVGYFGTPSSPPAPKVFNPPWKVGNTYGKNKCMKKGDGRGPVANIGKNPVGIRKIVPGETFQDYLANFVVEVTEEIQKTILQDIRDLTNCISKCDSDRQFAGHLHHQCTDVEFEDLKSQPYMAAWFPQEYFRYMLYFDALSNIYFVDTSNRVFSLPSLIFPSRAALPMPLFSTLIEGIVLRKHVSSINGTVESEYHFEMCDLIVLEGQELAGTGLGSRMKLLREILDSRRVLNYSMHRINSIDLPLDPFRVRIQPMWSASQFWKLQRFDWSQSYPVGPNGLIFYPIDSTKSSKVVKWTCPSTNTACFRVSREFKIVESDPIPATVFRLRVDDQECSFADLKYETDDEFNFYSALIDDIVECSFDKDTDSWKFKRLANKRIWSDTIEFVRNLRSGDLSRNIPTKQIFDYYGSQKQQKRTNTRWDSSDLPKLPKDISPPEIINELEGSGSKKCKETKNGEAEDSTLEFNLQKS